MTVVSVYGMFVTFVSLWCVCDGCVCVCMFVTVVSV